VKVKCQVLYHICSRAQQAKLPTNVGNSYNVYGIVMHEASGRRGWDVQFDVSTQEDHNVKSLTWLNIGVVEKGERSWSTFVRSTLILFHQHSKRRRLVQQRPRRLSKKSCCFLMKTLLLPSFFLINEERHQKKLFFGTSCQTMNQLTGGA
jgi:hypothetical protein